MKRILYLLGVVLLFSSCATQMVTKSPTEVKMMTTKQFESDHDLIFKSVISLLQSESYIVDRADKETGLINGSKRIENKNAAMQRFLVGTSKDANTSKVMIYIEAINKEVCEVKITLYEGAETSSNGYWGTVNKDVKEKMIYEPQVYSEWFNSLQAEIERRKALLN
ncbi:hypothetical protein PZ892_07265 [Sphingobacterium sp. WM]|uniref:hypothetical protein n=1 Tax=Sphingobacterium sp. WM TaxID=3031802 RepID=UPI00240E96DF|nr:hypothetical protein [Sphingobacterium sp. WM]WFB65005.1 hypothetical protein PZ892_07265 [Sphingobacterium sp. WM]